MSMRFSTCGKTYEDVRGILRKLTSKVKNLYT